MQTLGGRFDPRHNNLDVLRLGFAAMVAVAHAIVMRTGEQPYVGDSTIGDFGVDGFFVLSGFLITRSYLGLPTFARFVWHRLLRIMPGFWVCLLVMAFVVAPLGSALAGGSPLDPFVQAPTSLQFVAANAGLLINQYGIGQVFATNPNPSIVNGSLWTLALEALCYAIVGGLGLVGLLRRHRWVVPVIAAVIWGLTVAQHAGVDVIVGDATLRMTLLFLVGACGWLFAARIPMHVALALASIGLIVIAAMLFPNYRLVGVVPFTYLVLWLGTCLPRTVSLRTDLSYGIYIYHWPLFQLLTLTALGQAPLWVFVVVGLALAPIPALLSWHAVEHPALRHKNDPWPDRIAARCAALYRYRGAVRK